MNEDNKIVHSLWIGSTLSPLELLTLHSFTHFGHEFYLWTYNEIKTPLPPNVYVKNAEEIIPKSKVFKYRYSDQYGHGKGSYAGFSDLFRYALLYKYGGWWVDMDVTCIKQLSFAEPYVFRTHHTLNIVGNLIKCPPKSRLMEKCYEESLLLLDEFNKDWNLPIKILNRNVYNLGLQKYIRSLANADQWRKIKILLLKNEQIPEYYYAIHWINEEWRRHKLNKQKAIKNSFYYNLLNRYKLDFEEYKDFQKLFFRFKLSKIFSAIILIHKPKAFVNAIKLLIYENFNNRKLSKNFDF